MKIVGNTVGTTLDPEKYGVSGEDGATFIPSVDADGNLSWSNDKELENPAPVNIKGPKGEHGVDGKDGASGVYILADGETIEDAPEDADVVIDPSGEGDSTLPNPHALTLTGAVSATYDGSKAVEVEIPSGGGDSVYSETILTEAVSSVEFSLDGATEFSIAFNVPVVEAAMTYCFALINGKQTGFVTANIGATDKERFTFFTVKRVGERLWFMRIKTGNTDTYANSMFNTTEDIPINGGGISIGIETFGIKCYGQQQFPVGTTIYTIGGGGSL